MLGFTGLAIGSFERFAVPFAPSPKTIRKVGALFEAWEHLDGLAAGRGRRCVKRARTSVLVCVDDSRYDLVIPPMGL